MENNINYELSHLSKNPYMDPKYVVDLLFRKVYPIIRETQKNLNVNKGDIGEENFTKYQEVFMLCVNQIKKCFLYLFNVFKVECSHSTFLQESRYCLIERMSWCISRLDSINDKLEVKSHILNDPNESDIGSTMYFVNWIDHTFELLTKLTELMNNYNNIELRMNNEWINEVVECVTGVHISIDELLLSAMTLCKYCLDNDQFIIKARCQVVLRETKELLRELVEGDLDDTFKATSETLKLPFKPSNVNVLIDVLKDVLYILETNTNTALLALLIHCFTTNMPPVDILKDHVKGESPCVCHSKSIENVPENCPFVKNFDFYNERLLQIGSFAVSCSSDQNRIISVRSGLATLEALDPHLVPALMLSCDSHHTSLLMDCWRSEVNEIRDSVFLIVDPAAYTDKSKQMMHQLLLEITKEGTYNNMNVCKVINIGSVLYEFFQVYIECEPDALVHLDMLTPLLVNLNKAQSECKIVSNSLSKDDDFVYNTKKTEQPASFQQLLKRLKLLYTMVNRINNLLHPKESDDFDEMEYELKHTGTINQYGDTYANSPKKTMNISRSVFARNMTVTTSTVPLKKSTKNMKIKEELSFSMQLDKLMLSEDVKSNKLLDLREPSVLYNFSPIKHRLSLRKAVLDRHKLNFNETQAEFGDRSVMDETVSLQITDVLNQINELTISSIKNFKFNSTRILLDKDENTQTNSNVSNIVINGNATITKRIWNIPVNSDVLYNDSVVDINVTPPSNVTTLERINDLELVESRLSSLKSQLETSL